MITKAGPLQRHPMQRANPPVTCGDREYLSRHLYAALDAEDPTVKNFHVRTALQWLELAADLDRLE